jgi:hypothetical protein
MPVTEPGPLGTFSAYPAQPAPTRSAAGSAAAALLLGAAALVALEAALPALDVASLAVSLEHAARLRIAAAENPAAASLLR